MLGSNSRVLVVDDSFIEREIAKRFLSELGFKRVDEASDGGAAWAKILGSWPLVELVICDWQMPNLSGLDLLKKIRAHEEYRAVPFIMVTAERNREEVIRALQSGVNGYIIKPIEMAILKAAIEKL
jgi:two-component system, chemotaxis family, chemotaxis protein CheY